MALSSMGHSQASAQSLQSIAGVETERKISFVLHEPENVSGGSNVTVSPEWVINMCVFFHSCLFIAIKEWPQFFSLTRLFHI